MKLTSAEAEVTFRTLGAEITSFRKTASPLEYMWQGDPKYWKGRNPILFPIVGNTYSKTYQIDGKTYAMGNHGLTRHMDFTLVEETNDTLTFEVSDNEDTLRQYPFRFNLTVKYRLTGSKLTIDYEIRNTGDKTMPFSFGLHPAFNVPLAEGKFSDYRLEFEKEETPYQIDNDGTKFPCEGFSAIALNYELFERYPTLMYGKLKSDYVRLTDGREGIEVGIKDFPYLAFWCGEKAPFLCIEPWFGLGDFTANDTPFEKREGTEELKPGAKFNAEYYLRLL